MPPLYPGTNPTNTRCYGDNLPILREHVDDLTRQGTLTESGSR